MRKKKNSGSGLLGKVIFLVWVGVLIGGGIWGTYEIRNRKWPGGERFTVVKIGQESITIESVDPTSGEAVKVEVPEELELETLGGRGRWKVKVLPKLAEKYGRKWVAESITDHLRISFTAVSSEMNIIDKINWWRVQFGVQWREITLNETGLVAQSQAPDGDRVLGLSNRWEQKSKLWFASLALSDNNPGVRIVNTTSVAGLGNHAAEIVENTGLKVIMVGNDSEKEIDKCEVWGGGTTKKKPGTIFLLRNFKCDWKEMNELGEGEVGLRLGREYREWLFGPE